MQLTRFFVDGADRFGIVRDERFIDLSSRIADMADLAPVLDAGSAGTQVIDAWTVGAPTYPRDQVTRLVPLPGNSYRVFCAALNYPTHVAEGNFTAPSEPMIFFKLPSSLINPDADMIHPTVTKFLDYEGELAVIMGRTAKDVPVEEALDYVLGYSVFNEMTARDLQRREEGGRRVTDWFSSKALDAISPLGPYVVTKDEVGDADKLHLETRVNGETVQDTLTSELIFSVPELIAYISRRIVLQPFDVIATGTPAGVGRFTSRKLGHGDVVEVEVERVGKLRNQVRDDSAELITSDSYVFTPT